MANRWKGLIVVLLAAAVFAVIISKQPPAQSPAAATTASTSGPASGRSVATPPAPQVAASRSAGPQVATPPVPPGRPETKSAPKSPEKLAPAAARPAATAQKAAPAPKPKALPQMIELGSKTCVPCKMMQPILAELRREYKGQLEVPFWDIYEHPDKAKAYGIRVIPTQVFVGADGKEFFRHEGFFPKADILKTFRQHGVVLKGPR